MTKETNHWHLIILYFWARQAYVGTCWRSPRQAWIIGELSSNLLFTLLLLLTVQPLSFVNDQRESCSPFTPQLKDKDNSALVPWRTHRGHHLWIRKPISDRFRLLCARVFFPALSPIDFCFKNKRTLEIYYLSRKFELVTRSTSE